MKWDKLKHLIPMGICILIVILGLWALKALSQETSTRPLPFSTPLPRRQSRAQILPYPPGTKNCERSLSEARRFLSEGMPYPDTWVIHIVCNDFDWNDLLRVANMSCDTTPDHCTETAFTIIGADPLDPCTNDCALTGPIEEGHTYLRGRNFIVWTHALGPRHTMLHELGHIMAGRREENAEAWAVEWEKEYGKK